DLYGIECRPLADLISTDEQIEAAAGGYRPGGDLLREIGADAANKGVIAPRRLEGRGEVVGLAVVDEANARCCGEDLPDLRLGCRSDKSDIHRFGVGPHRGDADAGGRDADAGARLIRTGGERLVPDLAGLQQHLVLFDVVAGP